MIWPEGSGIHRLGCHTTQQERHPAHILAVVRLLTGRPRVRLYTTDPSTSSLRVWRDALGRWGVLGFMWSHPLWVMRIANRRRPKGRRYICHAIPGIALVLSWQPVAKPDCIRQLDAGRRSNHRFRCDTILPRICRWCRVLEWAECARNAESAGWHTDCRNRSERTTLGHGGGPE